MKASLVTDVQPLAASKQLISQICKLEEETRYCRKHSPEVLAGAPTRVQRVDVNVAVTFGERKGVLTRVRATSQPQCRYM